MSTRLEVLQEAALELLPGERAALAQKLLESLDEDEDLEAAWVAEAARRDAEIESGAVRAIPVEEALAHLRAMLE